MAVASGASDPANPDATFTFTAPFSVIWLPEAVTAKDETSPVERVSTSCWPLTAIVPAERLPSELMVFARADQVNVPLKY
jgi:hypothetical protein